MSDFITKHDFVDDYPYIAYAPKADTSITGNESSLPIASEDTLGGVKVGSGLSITEEGVLSASGGGGGEMVVPVFTYIVDDNDHLNCDMTFSQVNAAIKAGKCFFGQLDVYFYQLTEYMEDNYFIFERTSASVDGVATDSINYGSDNTIEYSYVVYSVQ